MIAALRFGFIFPDFGFIFPDKRLAGYELRTALVFGERVWFVIEVVKLNWPPQFLS